MLILLNPDSCGLQLRDLGAEESSEPESLLDRFTSATHAAQRVSSLFLHDKRNGVMCVTGRAERAAAVQ